MEEGWIGVGVFGNVVFQKVDCYGQVQLVHMGSFPSLESVELTKNQGEKWGEEPQKLSLFSSSHEYWSISGNFPGQAAGSRGVAPNLYWA